MFCIRIIAFLLILSPCIARKPKMFENRKSILEKSVFCELSIKNRVGNFTQYKYHLCTHIVYSQLDMYVDEEDHVFIRPLLSKEEQDLKNIASMRNPKQNFKLLLTIRASGAKEMKSYFHTVKYENMKSLYDDLLEKFQIKGLVLHNVMEKSNSALRVIKNIHEQIRQHRGEFYLEGHKGSSLDYKSNVGYFNGNFLHYTQTGTKNVIHPVFPPKNYQKFPSMSSVIRTWTKKLHSRRGFKRNQLVGEINLRFRLYKKEIVGTCLEEIGLPFKDITWATRGEINPSTLLWRPMKELDIVCADNITHIAFPETNETAHTKAVLYRREKMGGIIVRNFDADLVNHSSLDNDDLPLMESIISGFLGIKSMK